jgi:hypothetical protein
VTVRKSLQWPAEVLRLARARWANLDAIPHTCVVASRRTLQLYGVKRAKLLAQPDQTSHDLAVSSVLLTKLCTHEIQARQWRGEDAGNLRIGEKVADAAIDTGQQGSRTIIEVVGDYTQDKLLTIYRECQRRAWSLELW